MIGVVLWSDPAARKAVIWCEDHGDLAFYAARPDVPLGAECLDAGDLVEFDVTVNGSMRYAHNPQVVSERLYPDLAEKLDAAMEADAPVSQRPNPPQEERRILPFRPRRPAHRSSELRPSLSCSV